MLQRRGTTGSVTAVVVLEGVLSATVQVALPDSKSNSERAARQISPCTHTHTLSVRVAARHTANYHDRPATVGRRLVLACPAEQPRQPWTAAPSTASADNSEQPGLGSSQAQRRQAATTIPG